MSEYTSAYKSHPFHQEWSMLVDKTKIIEESMGSDGLPELLRFIAITHFINEQINSLNPDILPWTFISGLEAQQQKANEVRSYINNHAAEGHIQAANHRIDDILMAFYPYFTIVATKGVTALKQASTTFYNKVEEQVKQFNDNSQHVYQQMENRYQGIEQKSTEIENYHNQIFGSGEGTGEKAEISESIRVINNKFNEINELHDRLTVDNESQISLSTVVQNTIKAIEQEKNKASGLKDNADAIVEELSDFRDDMLGEEDEQGKRSGGMSGDLALLKSELVKFKDDQDKIYNTLKERIESLLPGATSAGLASAYRDMKESFILPIAIWNVLFFLAIGAMIGLSLYHLPTNHINWQEGLEKILIHLPLYLPLVWIAYFAIRRRNEAARLKQEYAHKEAIAKSFEGYKKQIEDLGEDKSELLVKLMDGSIDAITRNASKTLEKQHGEAAPPVEIAKVIEEQVKKYAGSK